MKKKNRILVLGLTFSMLISSGSLTGCDSAAGNMGKETTGVEYEEADYELSEESCSDSGIDAADPGTVDNETEKTAENKDGLASPAYSSGNRAGADGLRHQKSC